MPVGAGAGGGRCGGEFMSHEELKEGAGNIAVLSLRLVYFLSRSRHIVFHFRQVELVSLYRTELHEKFSEKFFLHIFSSLCCNYKLCLTAVALQSSKRFISCTNLNNNRKKTSYLREANSQSPCCGFKLSPPLKTHSDFTSKTSL